MARPSYWARWTKSFEKKSKLLLSARFLQNYRNFSQNFKIFFEKGTNVLVGDQGAGKSSLITLISEIGRKKDAAKAILQLEKSDLRSLNLKMFDFERNNPRITNSRSKIGSNLSFTSRYKSHGEVTNLILTSLAALLTEAGRPPFTLLLDEPDANLSIRSCLKLLKLLKTVENSGHQVILTAHNPIVIDGFSKVYDMEKRCWTTPSKFILSQSML